MLAADIVSSCSCLTAEASANCRRAGTSMVGPLWELCQRSAEYRELWDRLALGQVEPTPDGKARLKTCRHRGRSVKRDGKAVMRPVPT